MSGRRAFFSKLIGIGASAVVAADPNHSADQPNLADLQATEECTLNGWRYRWTGWKASSYNCSLIGQWTAERISPIGGDDSCKYRNLAYWSTTGCGDWFNRGDMFNVSLTRSGHEVNHESTKEQRESAKKWTLGQLMQLVDIEGQLASPRQPFD